MWVDADTLLWWVRPGPLAIPLVTTTTAPGTPLSGATSQPQTRVLFGGSDIDYGPAIGGRITLGGWLDCEQRFGVEGRGFLLESRAAGLHSASDPAGNPPLYIPAFSTNLNRERPLVVADPVVPRTGSVDLLLRTQLWGAEALGVFNVLRDETVTVDLLGGFRFLSLEENFRLDTRSTLVTTRTETVIRDRFDTLNCFYGAQIGGRGVYAEGPWLVAATARVAFGSTAEAITVTGTTTRGSDRTTPATTRGGFLTQPSNLGRHTADRFGLVPEGELQVGYQFGHGVTALFGYNALYWTQVARVSNQVDPDVNLTQSRVFGTGKLAGVARPVVEGHQTDFWAHGLSVSLQLAY
ncbi:MAG: BBP7 family outer membrane beta-barrel protein [Gemmataceae bacterium]